MMRVPAALLSGLAVGLLGALPASAALETYDVSFSATGFTSVGSVPIPVDPVTGAFTITFDPTQTYSEATAGITLKSLNITLGSALGFNYSPTAAPAVVAGQLYVGGIQNGVDVVQFSPSTDDFYLHIANFTTAPTFQQLGYTQISSGPTNYFYTPIPAPVGSGVTVTPVTTPVPEPASLALMLAGIGGLGVATRGSRRKMAAGA